MCLPDYFREGLKVQLDTTFNFCGVSKVIGWLASSSSHSLWHFRVQMVLEFNLSPCFSIFVAVFESWILLNSRSGSAVWNRRFCIEGNYPRQKNQSYPGFPPLALRRSGRCGWLRVWCWVCTVPVRCQSQKPSETIGKIPWFKQQRYGI